MRTVKRTLASPARHALVENDRLDARANESGASRAKLDAEELRELEQSLYIHSSASPPGAKAGPNMTATVSRRRSLIARLFRRG